MLIKLQDLAPLPRACFLQQDSKINEKLSSAEQKSPASGRFFATDETNSELFCVTSLISGWFAHPGKPKTAVKLTTCEPEPGIRRDGATV